MSDALLETDLAVAVIDALTSQICVVDPNATIIAVNKAWKDFAEISSADRQFDHVGLNYLEICRLAAGPAANEAPAFADGLDAVLQGKADFFQMEYPCHSPTENRWFLARVSPLRRRNANECEGAVVSHMNITDRKIAELKLAELASTDELTGLPNRRFFEEISDFEFERVRLFHEPLSLLMVDVDLFKRINDEHGHLVGDDVLRSLAASARSVLRASDLFARLGGEEFVGLLPRTDREGAIFVAEKLRTAIESASGVAVGENKIKITVSVGVATVSRDDRSIVDVVRRADDALLRAKEEGRNRVCEAA